jgi:hypothetical protein
VALSDATVLAIVPVTVPLTAVSLVANESV